MWQVQISLEMMKIVHCKTRRLKKRAKCTKIMNAEGDIHHIYLAPLFSSCFLPILVGKREAEWKKTCVRVYFLYEMQVSIPYCPQS